MDLVCGLSLFNILPSVISCVAIWDDESPNVVDEAVWWRNADNFFTTDVI